MTITEKIPYKDLDTHGPLSVEQVEEVMATQYGVPVLMTRKQYVHFAMEIIGLHRVLHNRPDELIERSKLAREVTRQANWVSLHPSNRPEQDSAEEKVERFWK